MFFQFFNAYNGSYSLFAFSKSSLYEIRASIICAGGFWGEHPLLLVGGAGFTKIARKYELYESHNHETCTKNNLRWIGKNWKRKIQFTIALLKLNISRESHFGNGMIRPWWNMKYPSTLLPPPSPCILIYCYQPQYSITIIPTLIAILMYDYLTVVHYHTTMSPLAANLCHNTSSSAVVLSLSSFLFFQASLHYPNLVMICS